MFTDLTPFGDPIEKDEFVQHYMTLFTHVVKQTYHIDTFFPKEKSYLLAEQQKISLLYDRFVSLYHRQPDYRYLSETLTTNFLAKESLFASHEQNLMSAQHFASIYIEMLKKQHCCTAKQFGNDWVYILQREKHRAITRYNKQDQPIEGYPELRIQNNSFIQQQLLNELMNEFHELYQAYRIN